MSDGTPTLIGTHLTALLADLDALSLDLELVSPKVPVVEDRYFPRSDHAKAAVAALEAAAA